MDLVEFSESRFNEIQVEYDAFLNSLVSVVQRIFFIRSDFSIEWRQRC